MACFLVLLRTARPCGWRAVLGPLAGRQPGSERHQAQDLLLSVWVDAAGRRVCDSGQIHAGARFHDGLAQAHEAVGLAQRGTVGDSRNGGMSDERHGWSHLLEDWTAQDASCPYIALQQR